MVEAGMSAAAIRSATVTNAMLPGLSESLGSIEANKLADLIAVPANPLQNIKSLQNVTFVMKGGIIYKPNN